VAGTHRSRIWVTEVTLPEAVKPWWTFSEIIDWFRNTDPNASILSICRAVGERCASGRVRARGRRRIFNFDRFPKISHTDPGFVRLSEEYSRVNPIPEPISTGEWRDLAFFARPVHKAGEEYLIGFARALEELNSPVELRSNSRHRLAWPDVEFSQEDLAHQWPHAGCEVERDAVKQEANTGLSADLGGGAAGPVFSVRRKAPVSDRELRSWYQNRVSELTAGGVTSSSEQDWGAAKREFSGRVTRARVRAIREEMTPEHWKKQGRRSALRGS
jgi:hypothetical protein